MISRAEAAEQIASVLEANEYSASVWTPEGSSGPVRVYVTIPAASWKKKARKIGYVAVNQDGTLAANLDVQSGTIMSLIPDLQITPAAPKVAVRAAKPEAKEEDITQFEASERRVGASESAREIG